MAFPVHNPPFGLVQGAPDLLNPTYFGIPVVGNTFFVDPANGSDGAGGQSHGDAFATLEAAYAAATAGQNDVIYYIAGTGSITLSETLTWAKSYTHLVGIAAPNGVGTRARIFQDADATGVSPLIDITASGCIFANFYVFQGVDDATSLVNIRVTGSRNYFNGVHFAGGGHASQAINGGASLLISGGSENTFANCTIGVDTIDAATGMAGLVVAATGGAARNRFIDCQFTLQAGNAGAIFVELLGNSGLDRYLKFVRCEFSNLSATAMTQAFAVDSGFDPANKRVLLVDCVSIGASKWDDGDTGMVYGNMDAVVGADASGELVEMIT
jgi:hypothetical protein